MPADYISFSTTVVSRNRSPGGISPGWQRRKLALPGVSTNGVDTHGAARYLLRVYELRPPFPPACEDEPRGCIYVVIPFCLGAAFTHRIVCSDECGTIRPSVPRNSARGCARCGLRPAAAASVRGREPNIAHSAGGKNSADRSGGHPRAHRARSAHARQSRRRTGAWKSRPNSVCL